MSERGGWGTSGEVSPASGRKTAAPRGLAAAIAEREAGDSLLRFLSRLSAFGLAADRDPLLKPVKPAG